MINTLLLYDNKDAMLGTFFYLCANKFLHLHNAVYNQNVSAEYHTENCEKETIESALSGYNVSNFLFVSFLHGDGDAMYIANEKIISSDNAYFFTNVFCYTFSCHCGKNLANKLLENGACVFWGYIDKAYSMSDYEEDFADLAISGLRHFFDGNSIEQSYMMLKEETTNKIDEIYQENFFVASTLLHNLDSMVIYGDTKLNINDFIITCE
jgi:hypothetical protein